ncbi:hypothetical protein DAPPUDRAFT_305119 [Daphnia pulex]|uniref:CUB domain-containing protein n=1 Tax=Daphnia pulex TaxID=6669 RepID=E9HVC0_DAPPU|nr:hypothetical protein DAPPUDRAFT_305119 [Daphnia pulex]|eukprot:EFX64299.1 hypothetical protein DAPPUDRAFT_305119 [Daphnia pulex]
MSKLQHLILVVVLVLQASISCASLANVQGDNEGLKVARQIPLINSYYNYNPSYAWRPWNSPYYQNYQPSARIPQTTTGLSPAAFPTVESTYVDFGGPSSCRSDCSEERGNCLDPVTCSMAGGRASGSCVNGFVCCVSVVNTCHSHGSWNGDGLVILNNTYWQSSLRPIEPSSSCTLTVKLDSRYPDPSNPVPNPLLPIPYPQKPICQVRLDFLVFSISQPDAESVCSGDYFEVAGATNNVPTICGFNDGQHMYLHVPNSAYTPTDLQLTFNFGPSSSEIRAWNILVSMIPCDSGNMAPMDCLQYFTRRTGSVKTFNWRDVAGSATRQLANQDYSICFRTVTVVQRQLCLTPCQVVTSQKPFSISTATTYAVTPPVPTFTTFTPDVSQLVSLNCNNDYLVVPGGFNVGNPPAVLNMAFDRYCGERFNALPGSTNSTTICTTAMPFRMLYRTNRDETLTSPTSDAPANSIPANGNRGFCLNFKV